MVQQQTQATFFEELQKMNEDMAAKGIEMSDEDESSVDEEDLPEPLLHPISDEPPDFDAYELDPEIAAYRIQRAWRDYLQRRELRYWLCEAKEIFAAYQIQRWWRKLLARMRGQEIQKEPEIPDLLVNLAEGSGVRISLAALGNRTAAKEPVLEVRDPWADILAKEVKPCKHCRVVCVCKLSKRKHRRGSGPKQDRSGLHDLPLKVELPGRVGSSAVGNKRRDDRLFLQVRPGSPSSPLSRLGDRSQASPKSHGSSVPGIFHGGLHSRPHSPQLSEPKSSPQRSRPTSPFKVGKV